MSGEMQREILLNDGLGTDHRVKYLDEGRVTVEKITRIVSEFGAEDYIKYSMPAKVRLSDIYNWPFTEDLKRQISEFHAQFNHSE